MRHFAERLSGVAALVDWEGSWFREFWQRDTEGMRACLEGREVPPWDVIESLLHDLARVKGAESAQYEAARLRPLYSASVRAYDRADGVKDTLTERLRLLREEQRRSVHRLQDLQKISASATGADDPYADESDLAWARDYYARICRRIAELRSRVAALEEKEMEAGSVRLSPPDPWQSTPQSAAPPAETAPSDHSAPAQRRKRRQRGSARFAGQDFHDEGGSVEAATGLATGTVAAPLGARFSGAPATVSAATLAAPALPEADAPLRGARFGGAADAPVARVAPAVDDTDRAAVARTVETLRVLRAQGQGGQAHAVLAEAAHAPSARFPLLAEALERADMAADWATLLWEAAALPLESVLAAAEALSAGGRSAEADQLLRQGMGRSPLDVGTATAGLIARARHAEARALLDICLRTRATSESARVALADPVRLVPLLLEAAQGISDGLHEDLVLSLRVAGMRAEVSAAMAHGR